MLLSQFNVGFCNNQYPYSNQSNSKTMSGSTVQNGGAGSLSYCSNISSTCHYCGNGQSAFHVIIGGGDTPPAFDDYDMADTSIIASDRMVSMVQTASYTTNGGTTITTQWKNKSSSPITVKEIGLASKRSSTTYDKGSNVLYARTVLETPVTVQPGETYAFSYNLKI